MRIKRRVWQELNQNPTRIENVRKKHDIFVLAVNATQVTLVFNNNSCVDFSLIIELHIFHASLILYFAIIIIAYK